MPVPGNAAGIAGAGELAIASSSAVGCAWGGLVLAGHNSLI